MRLFQWSRQNIKLITVTLCLFAVLGGILLWLSWLGNKKSGHYDPFVSRSDSWITARPRASEWREGTVLRYPSAKESARLFPALHKKPFIVLETKGKKMKIAVRAVVDTATLSPTTPKEVLFFQNGESIWMIGNGYSRRYYTAKKWPVIVVTTFKPKQLFVTLFGDESPK